MRVQEAQPQGQTKKKMSGTEEKGSVAGHRGGKGNRAKKGEEFLSGAGERGGRGVWCVVEEQAGLLLYLGHATTGTHHDDRCNAVTRRPTTSLSRAGMIDRREAACKIGLAMALGPWASPPMDGGRGLEREAVEHQHITVARTRRDRAGQKA